MEFGDISINQFFKLNVLLIFKKIGPVRAKMTEKLTNLECNRQTLADLPENCIYASIDLLLLRWKAACDKI